MLLFRYLLFSIYCELDAIDFVRNVGNFRFYLANLSTFSKNCSMAEPFCVVCCLSYTIILQRICGRMSYLLSGNRQYSMYFIVKLDKLTLMLAF